MRHYYKTTNEKALLNLKTPSKSGVEGYIAITEEEYKSILEAKRAKHKRK